MAAAILDPIPKRAGAGRRNLDLFLLGSESSPVCFYFEDEGCEELYKRFLLRLFPNYVEPLVICTGGKTKKQVLKEADDHKLSPVVFIQDKDFDDLIGTLPSDPRIVTLNRYSFENYLLDPHALIELTIESKRRLKRTDAMELLSLDTYLPDLYGSYRPLGALFVVSRRLNLKGVKTTKQPVSDLVDHNAALVSTGDLSRFEGEVVKAALAAQRISTPDELQAMIGPALDPKPQYRDHADGHPNAHLCGKHLLDLALHYIDQKIGTALGQTDRFEIVMRLVLHLSIILFERVKAAILISLTEQKAPDAVLSKMS